MFCHKCGLKLDEESNFCHECGTKINNSDTISSELNSTFTATTEKQQKEENKNTSPSIDARVKYMTMTDIKSEDEADNYLSQLRVLFWTVFISGTIIRGLSESESELAGILFILYIGLLIYFIYFCMKVLKAEKLSRANAVWCVLFAPISWLYLYPLMANPLKIIMGNKNVPNPLTEDGLKKKIENDKKTKFYYKLLLAIVAGIIVISVIVSYYQ